MEIRADSNRLIRLSIAHTVIMAAMLMLASFSSNAMIQFYYLQKAMPDAVGNNGSATIYLIGVLPSPPFEVALWSPTGDKIHGEVVEFREDAFEGKDVATVVFDVTGASLGKYDVQIKYTLPFIGPRQLYLFDAVTVEQGVLPELWLSIEGNTTVRTESTTTYRVWYGLRRGNVNMNAAVLFLAIPKWRAPGDPIHSLGFDLNSYRIEHFEPSVLDWSNASNSLELDIDGDSYVVYQLVVRDIPVLSFIPLKFEIKWGSNPSDYRVKAWWAGGKPETFDPIWHH